MILFKKFEIQSILTGKKEEVSFIYQGLQLIWRAIRSCFSGGFWNNTQSWSNKDGWKN